MQKSDAIYHSFERTTQESLKLNMALQGFFEDDVSPEHAQAYEAYLKRRLRSVLEVLLRSDDLPRLETLASMGWLNEGMIEDGLRLAVELKKTEPFVWFLRLKAETCGFHDRDYSL